MKLAINAFNIRAGGGVTHLVELLSAADPERYEFTKVSIWGVKSTLDKIPDKEWLEKFSPSALEKGWLKKFWWNLSAFPKLIYGYDVLYVPGGSYWGRFKPFVTFFQNVLPFDARERGRYFLFDFLFFLKLHLLRLTQGITRRRASGLVFPTSYAKEVIDMSFSLKSRNEIYRIIPHGINPSFLSLKEMRNINQSSTIKLLYVSTVDIYKHQSLLVEAVGELRKKNIKVELTLIGGFANKASRISLESTIKKVDSSGEFIYFLGESSYEDIQRFYHDADIFVMPSTCESISNVVQEAMASGLPVACSSRGAMSEILKDAGVYFDPEVPGDMEDAISKLIFNPELRRLCAKKSREYSMEYTWQACADRTFSFLKDVVSEYKD